MWQLPPILHRFQDMADYWSNFCPRQETASLTQSLTVNPYTWDTEIWLQETRSITVSYGAKHIWNHLDVIHECDRHDRWTDRQTDRWSIAYAMLCYAARPKMLHSFTDTTTSNCTVMRTWCKDDGWNIPILVECEWKGTQVDGRGTIPMKDFAPMSSPSSLVPIWNTLPGLLMLLSLLCHSMQVYYWICWLLQCYH